MLLLDGRLFIHLAKMGGYYGLFMVVVVNFTRRTSVGTLVLYILGNGQCAWQ